jgi:ankyrin repeat protein
MSESDDEDLLKDFAAAIEGNDIVYIRSLLSSREIDVNARLPRVHHPPALVHAVKHCRNDIVDLLLNAGARIDDVCSNGYSVCHTAVMFRDTDRMRLLLSHGPDLALRDMGWQNCALSRTLSALAQRGCCGAAD